MTNLKNYEKMNTQQQLQLIDETTKQHDNIFQLMIENLCEMNETELQKLYEIVSETYVKFDKIIDKHYGIHEHFRGQIDLIDSILTKKYE